MRPFSWIGLVVILGCPSFAIAADGMIDLANAVVIHGPLDAKPRDHGFMTILSVEAGVRRLAWPTRLGWEQRQDRPVIALGIRSDDLEWTGPFADRLGKGPWPVGPEGYRIETDPSIPAVIVIGNDERGALLGAGRLLREIRFGPGQALLPSAFRETAAPRIGLRGHQLGYRAKTNSYDAWDKTTWFRYIHELVVFGANAVELIPPRTDDNLDSPHFPIPPLKMLTEMTGICDLYGLETWLWFPVMDPVDTDASKVEPLLKEWDEVFKACKRLDAVFVPGGDPGSIPPTPLFGFLEKAAGVLRETHPRAELWVSPQGFDAERMAEFLELARTEPKWLAGIVFGPQVRMPLAELRKALPQKLPIRAYPDITHSRQCQHPVPDWDLAYAVTEGRESINPRPQAMARLVKAYQPDTLGFITYSEGCNDDVNKAVWSALGVDPDADLLEVLRQYGRYFLGDRYAESIPQVILGLERNWSGPLLTNGSVESTFSALQTLERDATPADRLNWRFQQLLYRGYYDAYVRDRLIQESLLQHQAMDALRQAPRTGSDVAMRRATTILDRALTEPVGLSRRDRLFELGEALYQSIRMQLSVAKYQAIAAERGANLDTVDTPLNDRLWINAWFDREVRRLPSEPDRLAALDRLVNRQAVKPGGFHDVLGDPGHSPHLVRLPSYDDDPMFVQAPFRGFALRTDLPVAWRSNAMTFYDAPLTLRYEGLHPESRYRVRVVYSGDSPRAQMRLLADEVEVHPFLDKPDPVSPVTFAIPTSATADGRLTLTWNQTPGRGGNGRGCQVAEVWLEPLDP
ncbi:MAG: hypothetical protein AB7I30_04575 [Isosphaeraceae bacterium]